MLHNFNVGDSVKNVDPGFYQGSVHCGTVGIVTKIDPISNTLVEVEVPIMGPIWFRHDELAASSWSAQQTSSMKFKKGDRVEVVHNYGHGHVQVGDLGRVENVLLYGYDVQLDRDISNSQTCYFRDVDLTLIGRGTVETSVLVEELSVVERWKLDGRCPHCGELGRYHLSVPICPMHGIY